MNILSILNLVLSHPLNRSAPLAALSRFIRWQVASRLLPEAEFSLPFVNDSRLLVNRGMAGATGNFYCGLFEVDEMGFVRHVLAPGDVFVDVGANIGSYTILAAEVGARVIAVEPIPEAHARLAANVRLNCMEAQVETHRCGVADAPGRLRFSVNLDTVNHVLSATEAGTATEVEVVTLDSLLAEREPALIKIDVEGYELPVLRGAGKTLQAASLLAVIVETNDSGSRYGRSDAELYSFMQAKGFDPYSYAATARTFSRVEMPGKIPENTVFLKRDNLALTESKVARAAETRLVNGAI